MKKCIYCLRSEPDVAFGSKGEHVIPQSFGKFGSQTPTLKCVCTVCNNQFGNELDIVLSRDSLEAMQRYRHGIRSSEGKRPHKRVTMKLADEERPEGVPPLRFSMDGETGRVNVEREFTLKKRETGEEISITLDNVDTFDIEPWLKGVDVTMSGKPEEMRLIFDHLEARGMKFLTPFEYKLLTEVMPKDGQVLIESTGVVDDTIKRAIAKILFNFTAKFIGEEVVLAPEWEEARVFIREGAGKIQIDVNRGIFWDMETEHIVLDPPGTNIRIENKNGSVWGYIQFFNMMIYEVKLAGGYQIPEEQLIGGKFAPGEEPLIFKPIRITSPLYIPQYDVDKNGRVTFKIRRYGVAR